MAEFKVFFKECENKLKASDAENEATLIFSHVLNISKGQVKLQEKITNKQKKKILKIIKARKKHLPLQHLLKNVHFLNLNLKVNKHVLIPRNETEQLADLIVKDVKKLKNQESMLVLDMCCGSGCLGLAVAKNTKTFVTLADISKKAIKIAKNNAKTNKIENVEFKRSDLFEKISKKYDVFISNPPYIKTQDIQKLKAEVKNFEPKLALDGGKDGLNFYKKIIKHLEKHLKNGAIVYFEVGYNQAKQVEKMLKKHIDFENVEILKDYYNVERIIKAKYKS